MKKFSDQSNNWYLKHLIYRHQYIDDDFVITPEIIAFVTYDIINENYGYSSDAEYRSETSCVKYRIKRSRMQCKQ